MTQTPPRSTGALWARFRFSVVGSLLSAPPARGELKTAIRDLAAKTWSHPVSGRGVRFSAVTIERWYYIARRERDDPVRVLRRAVRKDCGKVSLAAALAERLYIQYGDHQHWSYQLHYDNLAALVKADPTLGPLRSYSTVRRYMQAHGLVPKPRLQPKGRPGEARAEERRQTREIRSYEAAYVGSLWHLDFHHGSLKVLTQRGQWLHPIALGILDDHSRLCCHVQYVLRSSPSSESLRDAFRLETKRIQRRSDGTISVQGVRFEIPARYRHFHAVAVRYARWNLGRVDLVDPHSGTILAPIYPLDKSANADGCRALIEPGGSDVPAGRSAEGGRREGQLPPLLKRILEEYSATGMPPAYLPKTPPPAKGEAS